VQVRTKIIADEAKPKLPHGPQHPCHEDATGQPTVGSTTPPTKHVGLLQGHSPSSYIARTSENTFTGSAALTRVQPWRPECSANATLAAVSSLAALNAGLQPLVHAHPAVGYVADVKVASWAQGRRWTAFIAVFFATALVGLTALVLGQTPVAAVAGVIWFLEGHILIYLRWQRRADQDRRYRYH
jgi:hypothetical protein